MDILVDTSVWSLAFRRDAPVKTSYIKLLTKALDGNTEVYVTGIVLQELLQGFLGPKAQQSIVDHFASLPVLVPHISDHIDAASLRNRCRRKGIQVGTIDALIAQLSIRYELALLTADEDFVHISKIVKLNLAQ